MAKVVAYIALKQKVVALTLPSHKMQNFSCNLLATGINQSACLPNLKLKSLAVLNMGKTISHGMDGFQGYTYPIFRPFGLENDDYVYSDGDKGCQLRGTTRGLEGHAG